VGLQDRGGKNSIVESVTIWVSLMLGKSIWVDWSSVCGPSISPDIRFLLSINGSLSSGLSVSVGLVNGIGKDSVVESVTIWDSSSLHGS